MSRSNYDGPQVVDPNAPDIDELEGKPSIDGIRGLAAVDYDGGRYCLDCANEEYVTVAVADPYSIPYGGPVWEYHEVDCPGHCCSRCQRTIPRQTLLHYDGVCQPDTCPQMKASSVEE